MRCDCLEALTVINPEIPEACVAKARCLFQYRIEYRHEVARRGVDHLQDFCGSFLSGERFVEPMPQFGVLALDFGRTGRCHAYSPLARRRSASNSSPFAELQTPGL